MLDEDIKESSCTECNNSNSEEKIEVDGSNNCSCSSFDACNKNELDLNCYSCEEIHHSPERKSRHCQDDRRCTNEVWIDDCKCDESEEHKRAFMICKCCNRYVFFCYTKSNTN